jgi:3-methyladenine DNA glycosylase AlkD
MSTDEQMTAAMMKARLRRFADKEKAEVLRGFFKTGPGQYGEGDLFLGVAVPSVRKVAREFRGAPLEEITKLLPSAWHEERLLALLMLVDRFATGDDGLKTKIYRLYLRNTRYINNWDFVDLTAPNIVGAYLEDKSRKQLYAFARSKDLWKRRISILATFAFIRRNDFVDTLGISELLLADGHDLMHKAVGWMLREVGKRSLSAEEKFLKRHYKTMPRTMLRYAIERFPEAKRQKYLKGSM